MLWTPNQWQWNGICGEADTIRTKPYQQEPGNDGQQTDNIDDEQEEKNSRCPEASHGHKTQPVGWIASGVIWGHGTDEHQNAYHLK